MPDARYVSTEQASRALGVSVSTIKRWVDEGVLPAHRTPGGHRKLLEADILRLARQEATPPADLGALTVGAGKRRAVDAESLTPALWDAVVGGDAAGVQSLLEGAYRAGLPVETIADCALAPVMHRLGCEWEDDRLDVWQEHRGTQACVAATHKLLAEVQKQARRRRPVAVGAAPPGDLYVLPSLLAQLVLTDAGWDAVNLGPDTPFESLTEAVRELRPRIVWLSVSHVADAQEFIQAYRKFQQSAQQQGVAVAIGGRALDEPLRSQMPYTSYGDGLTHLAALARSLHPQRKRPRRGRPPSA